ncbi:hypothetical protein B566_EDAN006401 [Ephemera danica]|nr:hypothetical protein B566_EDAN006401 [Ephemera danica]
MAINFILFRFATRGEIGLVLLAAVAALCTGVLMPLLIILYGEFTEVLVDNALNETAPVWKGDTNIFILPDGEEDFMRAVASFGIICCSLGLAQMILAFVFVSCLNYTAEKQILRIRISFLRQVLRQEIGWYDTNQTGDFASRLTEDLVKLQDGMGEKLGMLLFQASTCVTSIIIAFVYGWELTLVVLSCMPFLILSTAIVTKVQSSMTERELQAYASAGAVCEEVLAAIRTVMAFGGEKKEAERYATNLKPARNTAFRRGIFTGVGNGVMWFITFATYAVAFWYGVGLVIEGRDQVDPAYTPANMAIVFFCVLYSAMVMGQAAPFLEAISVARGAAASVYALVDRESLIDSLSTKGDKPEHVEGDITFIDVTFSYPSRLSIPILQGLNLKVHRGETVALVGASGCGKSTCLQLIQRFYDPLEGKVELDGKDIRTLNVGWLRSQIGVVGQEPVLFDASIEENIRQGRRDATLSGGQKQRIAIARALVRHPAILILDEATSALDTNSESQVQQALVQASKGRTTIIVAHRLSTVRGANRIVVLGEGRLLEQGTHEELMARHGVYYDLDDEEAEAPMSRILKLNQPEWVEILIGCIGAFIVGCSMPVFAVLFGDIYGVLSLPDVEDVRSGANFYSIMFLVTGVITGIGAFLQMYMFNSAGTKMTTRLREQSFAAILRQEVAWFDDQYNSTGALCARLAGDAASVQGATGTRVGTIIQTIATLSLGLGLALFYSWKLGLVTASFVPVVLLSIILESQINRKQNYSDLLSEPHKTFLRTAHLRGLAFGFGQAMPFLAYGLCLYYGGYLVYYEDLHYSNIIKVTEALLYGTMMLGQALAFAPDFNQAKVAANKIIRLLERKPQIYDTSFSMLSADWRAQGEVVFRDLQFAYPSRPLDLVLRGLSFVAHPGQTVALVGPSGCGKSTCLQLLQRFYDPMSGLLAVDDHEVSSVPLSLLRAQLGVVSQEPVLFDRTLAENIAYGDNDRDVPMNEVISAARQANIHEFMTALPQGYETRLGERGAQLSGGQKQRVAIARALVRNPRVLLLDEATSALDAESEKVVQAALDGARRGRTCVVIAHRLSTIQDADVICVIQRGRVVESGRHAELLARRGVYYRLHSLQIS